MFGHDNDAGEPSPSASPEPERPGPSARRSAGGERDKDGRDLRPAPAWIDDNDVGENAKGVDISSKGSRRKLRKTDDETIVAVDTYEGRLRDLHEKLHRRGGQWARDALPRVGDAPGAANGAVGVGDEAPLTMRAGPVLAPRGTSTVLPAGQLDVLRLRDANHDEPSRAVVRAVSFHAGGQVLLTAGLDKRLRLFAIDGARNPKLSSVFFEDTPLTCADWCLEGNTVLASGRRPHFYLHDAETGKTDRILGLVGREEERSWERFGVCHPGGAGCATGSADLAGFIGDGGAVPLFHLRHRSMAGCLRVAGAARHVAFSGCGREVLVGAEGGLVHVFDLRQQRCTLRIQDEGATQLTSLACSQDGPARLWAAGSDAGVVNLYHRSDADSNVGDNDDASTAIPGMPQSPAAPKPLKTFLQLKTQVDTARFSPDGSLLALASRMEKDALRLVHLPTRTEFQNWPTSKSPLGHVHCLDFSPGCGYLAIGNARGRCLLYRLRHFPGA